MYGTVYRMRPKPGQEQAVVAKLEQWMEERGPKVPGAIAGYVYRSERNPGQLIGVAVFRDREAYRRNADDPEQDRWYRELRELLTADPEWEDGEILGGGQVTSRAA